MSGAEKISNFLNKAKVFYLLTTDGEKPKGRPFGFHLLVGDKVYFGTATVKKCYQRLVKNPQVEILALADEEFLRYDGIATIVNDENIKSKVSELIPQLMEMYDENGLEMGLFYLENGTAEICTAMVQKEAFEV